MGINRDDHKLIVVKTAGSKWTDVCFACEAVLEEVDGVSALVATAAGKKREMPVQGYFVANTRRRS